MTPADLFAQSEAENLAKALPLAAAMRPTSLDEVVGQRQLLDEGKLLRRMVRSGQLGSIILYGPPGTGKTTLAGLLASETGSQMRSVSAVTSGVKELRQEIQRARETVASGERRPVLFVDEIHRFSKTQQDALLPDVEQGTITLIGATTSNPFFAVNNALISRSQIFALEALEDADIVVLLRRAITDSKRGLGRYGVSADEAALLHLAAASEGDARKALSCLEIAVRSMYGFGEPSSPPLVLSLGDAKSSVQQKSTAYDGTGDDHYDLASALIKSIRGSDADAAVYWLARMLEGGEDIRFLCRRLLILASEDIGNADPQSLVIANACMQACEFVGLPEAQLTLSQTVAYLALAPKSNAATAAISMARKDVRSKRVIPVPRHLQCTHYAGAKELGHGDGYEYSHDAEGGIAQQDYLGVDRRYYQPTDRGFEKTLTQRSLEIRKRLGRDDSADLNDPSGDDPTIGKPENQAPRRGDASDQ